MFPKTEQCLACCRFQWRGGWGRFEDCCIEIVQSLGLESGVAGLLGHSRAGLAAANDRY